MLFDKVGIGTTTIVSDLTLQVGSGSSLFSVDGTGGVGIGTTANGIKLNIEGDVRIGAGFTIYGDGSGITNQDSIWAKGGGNTFIFTKDDADLKVAIGSSSGVYAQAHIAGTAQTSLYSGNESRFNGVANFDGGAIVTGVLTATGAFDLDSTSGQITAGVVTATNIKSGTGSTVMSLTPTGVGIGTAVARAQLDVEGRARFGSYHEVAANVTSSSGIVVLDLSKNQTFLLTTSEAVTRFDIKGVAADSTTAFTIKILQGTGPFGVGINTFSNLDSGSSVPVYWPGGVLPVVTPVAGRSDIYSFMTFDGGTSLYGVIGGQNFS